MKKFFDAGKNFLTLLLISLSLSFCDRNSEIKWIEVGGEPTDNLESFFFRKTFYLEKNSNTVILKVSAHQRYKLYVNGKYTGMGPQVSDPDHPRYDSYNIEQLLVKGSNTIAIQVINFGEFAGENMFPGRTALWVNCEQIEEISSNETWKVSNDPTLHGIKVRGTQMVRGGFLAPGCDSVINIPEFSEWYQKDYDDKSWKKEMGSFGGNQPSERSIPFMEQGIE
ncbi:MAG: hypothetical protein ACP5E3_09010, partial [Bacteroidales bacterium]